MSKSPKEIEAAHIFIGSNVTFGENVIITGFKNLPLKELYIGDDCVFHDGVEIRVGGDCAIGSQNIFHNNVHMVGSDTLRIGNYNWVAERSFLDSTGQLSIGNSCVIGVNCMIWSHVARPINTYSHLPLDRTFDVINKHVAYTQLGDYTWLMGGNIQICPGVFTAEGTVVLSNAVLSNNTAPYSVYGGVPARRIYLDKDSHTMKTLEMLRNIDLNP